MDPVYSSQPRFSPVVGDVPYRYSVAVYHGKKRVIIAWFSTESDAIEYLIFCRRTNPSDIFDYLQSMF